MPQLSIDPLAVAAATVASFLFGALWYGLLGKPWMRAAGIDPADATMSAGLFATTFVLQVITASGLSLLLSALAPEGGIGAAVLVATIAWLGLTAAPMAINHRYQGKGWDLTVIDGLHWLCVLVIMAIILTVIG